MAKLPETLITEACIDWANRNGGDCWHVHGSAFQRTGEPDICGEFHTPANHWLHLKIEVKLMGQDATRLQQVRLDKYEKRGYTVGVVHSLDEFKEIVKHAIQIRDTHSG
jgi:hypothetical protein